MGWVTLDDGQHVLIGPGGKTLATRAQISAHAGGGRERGQALAGRSKTAVARAVAKARAGKPAKAAGRGTPERAAKAAILRQQYREKTSTPLTTRRGPKGQTVPEIVRRQASKVRSVSSMASPRIDAANKAWNNISPEQRAALIAKAEASANHQKAGARYDVRQSPATTRAVEHARAAAAARPSLREQAEKARAAKGQVSTSRAEYLAKIGKPEKDAGVDNRASKLDLRKIADEARAAKGQVSTSKAEYLAKIKARKEATAKPAKRYR